MQEAQPEISAPPALWHPDIRRACIQHYRSAIYAAATSRHLATPRRYLRLRERSLTGGVAWEPSSSTTLSVLRKCLKRKWRSSCVGWKGNWCNNSWEEEDCGGKKTGGCTEFFVFVFVFYISTHISPACRVEHPVWRVCVCASCTTLSYCKGLL